MGKLNFFLLVQWRTSATQHDGSSINEVASPDVTSILERAQSYLNASIKTFEIIRQARRVALVYCNIGSLMHIHANMNAKNSSLEDYYYDEALKNYFKAREILCVKERYPSAWENIAWNLSTTSYIILKKRVKKFFDTEHKVIDSTVTMNPQYIDFIFINVSVFVYRRTKWNEKSLLI